ncbi:hypothetical protein Tco_0608618 [Tanacetum coccineum]
MSITKEQQQALDDALVPCEQRLRIGNCNYRLSTTFKPKEPTFQVALDVLSLTPFYQAFLISTSVPVIYMHEFWATICQNLPGQKFVDPSFEEEIFDFIRELGYPRNMKSLSNVKVETLPQPWRTFGTIINKCLSDLVYQIENKVSKKNKDMYYPRFTKVIINHFVSKDQSIPRRNKYDAILPDTLTNQAMKDSDAYKTYYDLATGKVIPKPKYVRRSTREKTDQAPKESPVVTKRSKTDYHVSHASGSDVNEGTGVTPGVLDVPLYGSEDEQIFWKSSDDEDDDETESDNDGDDFIHPKFSTYDEEERQDEEDKEEEGSDLRVQTPYHFKSTDDETYDKVTQRDNVEGEKLDEEETNEEEEVNELYRDANVNLERRDTKMTDALQTNVQGTQVIEDTHVIITAVTPEVQQQSSSVSSGFISNMLNPNPDTCIDSILNLNTESTSLVDVPVTTNVEMPPSSVTTLPPPPIPLVQPQQQTPVPKPGIVPTVSSIPYIVDTYLANKINEAIKAAVQLQSDRLRDEAQAKNKDFINKLDENMRKIIKEQVKEQVSKILTKIKKSVSEQLEAEVLIRSSNEAKTSHPVAANLSELELKKILIDKMENNKSIDRSIQQKTL